MSYELSYINHVAPTQLKPIIIQDKGLKPIRF